MKVTKFISKGIITSGLTLFPLLSFAGANFGGLTDLGNIILSFVNEILVPLVFALAFLVFIWGVARYFIFSGGSEEGKEQGKSLMLWGIIAFFVMVAIWGIVNLLTQSSGLSQQRLDPADIPDVPGPR